MKSISAGCNAGWIEAMEKGHAMRYVVIEGLPAAGKSELLGLLERFYPDQLRVLPELVKTTVKQQGIDLFRDRERLTAALAKTLPERKRAVKEILARGMLCLEEAHLGVHWAYSRALGDEAFVAAYKELAREDLEAPVPDAYVRLEISPAVSVSRQEARGTPGFFVGEDVLARMLNGLQGWHLGQGTSLVTIDAECPASEVTRAVESFLGLTYTGEPVPAGGAPDVLLLLGRPAGGKSEFIDFMQKCDAKRRWEEFHLGVVRVLDDFPILWEKFLEDDVWESITGKRRDSRPSGGNYMVSNDELWPFLIEQLNRRAMPILESGTGGETLIIEFARGGASGYRDALERLSPAVLERAAILYISVPFEESWRRNVARYDEARRGGILTHSVPREEMERSYGSDDWNALAPDPVGMISVGSTSIPYVTLNNVPELKDPDKLAKRYGDALDKLYAAWSASEAGRSSSNRRMKFP